MIMATLKERNLVLINLYNYGIPTYLDEIPIAFDEMHLAKLNSVPVHFEPCLKVKSSSDNKAKLNALLK